MQPLGLSLEILEAAFGVDVDGVFGDVAPVEALPERLGRLFRSLVSIIDCDVCQVC